MRTLIATEQLLYESPSPGDIFCYTPFLAEGFHGRLIATCDLGGSGVASLPGPKTDNGDFGGCNLGLTFVSDDHGRNWRRTGDFPMLHARVFRAGDSLWLIGHSGRLLISRSRDNGESWEPAAILDDTRNYHQSGCTIDFRHGKVYLVMERAMDRKTWPDVSLVLMSAEENADLTNPANWTFSNEWDFAAEVSLPQPFGMPFFPTGELTPGCQDIRYNGEPGNLETNVLRLHDSGHLFHDPEDRTMVLLSRLHSGTTNLATMLRGRELPDGTLRIDTFTTPGGAPFLFLPLPGGQMKFQIVYDDVSKLYWMVSTQATDSMTRPELLNEERFNLPNNERRRLMLSFSRNLIDWNFAGLVAIGEIEKASRHYASLLIDGNDLLVLSRSGDRRAPCAHNGNLLTLHRVAAFRTLVY